jgi:hypothetical protein
MVLTTFCSGHRVQVLMVLTTFCSGHRVQVLMVLTTFCSGHEYKWFPVQHEESSRDENYFDTLPVGVDPIPSLAQEHTWKWIKYRNTCHCCQLFHTFCTPPSVQGQGYLLASLLLTCRSIWEANYTAPGRTSPLKLIQQSVQSGRLVTWLLCFLLRLFYDCVPTAYHVVLWRVIVAWLRGVNTHWGRNNSCGLSVHLVGISEETHKSEWSVSHSVQIQELRNCSRARTQKENKDWNFLMFYSLTHN